MQNKHLIILLTTLVVASATFFLFMGESVEAPATDKTATAVEKMDYIGLTTVEAFALAKNADVLFRVVAIDGEIQSTTRDVRAGRINATVTDGIVISYTIETMDPPFEELIESELHTPATATPIESDPIGTDVIIGMTTAQATAYTSTNNIDFRVGTIDGEGMALTMDYRIGRITARTVSDIVVGYTVE